MTSKPRKVYPAPPHHQVEAVYLGLGQAGPEDTSLLHLGYFRHTCSCSAAAYPQHTPTSSWRAPYDLLTAEDKWSLICRWLCTIFWNLTVRDCCGIRTALRASLEGQQRRQTLPGTGLSQYIFTTQMRRVGLR